MTVPVPRDGAEEPLVVVAQFVRATRAVSRGCDAVMAASSLLPVRLGADVWHRRVHVMVGVGALLTGVMAGPRPDPSSEGDVARRLADNLIAAGAELDCAGIRHTIAAECETAVTGDVVSVGGDIVLTNVLVELVRLFAARADGASR